MAYCGRCARVTRERVTRTRVLVSHARTDGHAVLLHVAVHEVHGPAVVSVPRVKVMQGDEAAMSEESDRRHTNARQKSRNDLRKSMR